MNLADCRKKIDQIDVELVRLLNERARVVLQVGRLKRGARSQLYYVPHRERQVLANVIGANKGPLPDRALEAIWREIMSASLAIEKPIRVAFLGPEATFAHIAALSKFGQSVEYAPLRSIGAVFAETMAGDADYGVVPVENSTEGNVAETLDMFLEHRLKVCAEIRLPIHHSLLARCSLKQVRRVVSRPIAVAQCRSWLTANLPKAEIVDADSTASAAQVAARLPNAAAIAHRGAAELYGLKVLAENIEDRRNNVTRFFVIGPEMSTEPTGRDKTALLFAVKHKPGSLCDALVPFKRNLVNITVLQSRPFRQRSWEYYFFVEVQGHCQELRMKRLLKDLNTHCTYLQVLGSFPVADDEESARRKTS